MKNTLTLLALLIFGLTSCSYREDVEPAIQTVTYQVECDWCVVYFEDNRYQGDYRQEIAIDGYWEYTFDQKYLKTARLEVWIPIFSALQHLRASISTNNGLKTQISEDVVGGENVKLELPL